MTGLVRLVRAWVPYRGPDSVTLSRLLGARARGRRSHNTPGTAPRHGGQTRPAVVCLNGGPGRVVLGLFAIVYPVRWWSGLGGRVGRLSALYSPSPLIGVHARTIVTPLLLPPGRLVDADDYSE